MQGYEKNSIYLGRYSHFMEVELVRSLMKWCRFSRVTLQRQITLKQWAIE